MTRAGRLPTTPDERRREREFEALYRDHAGWLAAGLRRRLGSGLAGLADDLVQETYLRAARITRDTDVRHPRALLMRIASRLLVDQVRTRRRVERAGSPPTLAACEGPTQDVQLLLKQAVLALPPRQRAVFLLSRIEGFTNVQIAERLGLSVKTVEARMTRALAQLAAALQD